MRELSKMDPWLLILRRVAIGFIVVNSGLIEAVKTLLVREVMLDDVGTSRGVEKQITGR